MNIFESKKSVQRCLKEPTQCCVADPIWIFIYSDGSVFAICKDDFEKEAYRTQVKKIINIESQKSFSPEEIFNQEEKIGN